jgi:hypothetical protein
MQPNACAVQKVKDGMTGSGTDKGEQPPRPQKRPTKDPFDVLYPALQVGGLSGTLSACYPLSIAIFL